MNLLVTCGGRAGSGLGWAQEESDGAGRVPLLDLGGGHRMFTLS